MLNESSSVHSNLQETALHLVLDKLRAYGNEISEEHETALSGLCELASLMLTGQANKRVRFALPCGMGKTTAIRAILSATHQLNLPFRIVVASSKVEELCSLKRTLIGMDGVPSALVGLQHSYPHNPRRAEKGVPGYASEPASNCDAQFLLVTHANVQSGVERGWMRKCDLVLFDESLVVGEAECLPLIRPLGAPSVFNELQTLKGHAHCVDRALTDAASIVSDIFNHLHDSASKQRSLEVGVVQAQCVSQGRIQAARNSLSMHFESFPLIRQLLEWCESAEELRVYGSSSDRTSLITYAVNVPDELTRVMVLDASDPIRTLVHQDHRMERAEDVLPSLHRFSRMPGGMASIKQHSGVQVHFGCDAGGRSILTRALAEEASPWLLEKLTRLILSKPDETFLIVTYRSRESGAKDFSKRVLRSLIDAGVDPDASIVSPIDGTTAARVAITTWGRETGTNQYSTYQNVVLLGVARKPDDAVAGAYLGQVDDLRHPQMKSLAKSLVDSEARHSILQAINRIRMRRVYVVDGVTQALPCNVYIWHRDHRLECELETVLPGCPPWRPWREDCEAIKVMDVAMNIRSELERASSSGETKVSFRALRKRIGVDVSDTTFRRGREMAVDGLPGWLRTGASLERIIWS